MKTFLSLLINVLLPLVALTQGMNSHWLLGNDTGWPNLGRIVFDNSSYQLLTEQRKMTFKGTQATISDQSGNFLMSSNGVWIANANNDTMMNGSGLNPSWDVIAYPNGLLTTYGNILLPFPGDSSKYALIHQARFTSDPNSLFGGIHYSKIDINMDGGLGAVILKNDTLIQDELAFGIAACKHANGRDWWVIAQRDSSDVLYIFLITPNGVENITTQSLGYNQFFWGNVCQATFSQDGTRFIKTNYYYSGSLHPNFVVISNFDRCSGIFFNTQTLPLTLNSYLWGLALAPSGKYVYAASSQYIFQIDSDLLTVDTVATYDGYVSGFPPNCCATTFFNMYLASNGKIYTTSGSSVQHIHEMNFPDSAGVACDVQQHNIALGNYFHLRAVPNHPNYYLGPLVGSGCDSLGIGITEQGEHDFRFSIASNPNNGAFRIMYLLPQNESGILELFDVTGKRIYEMNLPPWSTMQNVSLPETISNGIYNGVITSGGQRVSRKLAIVR